MIRVKRESWALLLITIGVVFVSYAFLSVKLLWEIWHERNWIKSHGKLKLLQLEDQLIQCLQSAQIPIAQKNPLSIETIIEQQGYQIKEKHFMLLREAYTTKKPQCDVYVKKSLSSDKRHFALTHELMHIIYKPEELDEKPLGRNIHLIFRIRDDEEQVRDYMAASLILKKDVFWKELEERHFFALAPKQRKEFVFDVAQRYDVEPSMVFRRINELKVIMS